jgi:DNA-binding CsgD family transcriptional regulator/tetratricopeptide (TPR) repeat protein
MRGLVGREQELKAAAEFFDRLRSGPAALVFEGEPGIGKTSLWLEAIRRARECSLLVLAARPAEAEARLDSAALSDLLEPVADAVMPNLPEPQRRALAVMLLREDSGGRPSGQRAVSAATLSVLTALARTAPVVVAVDDLQWLDRASAGVLAFGLRRLGRLPVGLLASERIGHGRKPGPGIAAALPDGQVRRIRLGSLPETALHQIVQLELGRTLPRRTLARIGQVAGGSPLFAVEIARSLPDEPPRDLAVLPVPDNLRGLFGTRIAALRGPAREALLAAMLRCPPTVELVAAALGMTAAQSRHLLEHAAAAGIVEVTGSRLELQRRSLSTAENQFHVGELQTARELIQALLEPSPAGRLRADALRLLGEIVCYERSFPEATRLFKQALEHATDDVALASALELHLSFAASAVGDWDGAEPHARRALTLTEQSGDQPRLAEALAVSAILDYLLGRGLDEAKLERALALEDEQRQTIVEMRPSLIAGHLMLYEGRVERACQLLEGVRKRILDRGEESDLPYPSASLAWAECWRGQLEAAAFYADEALETASRIGDSVRCRALACASVTAAYSGDAEATRSRASEALVLAATTGYWTTSIWARWALAILALSLREPAAADAALAPLTQQVEREGVAEPARAIFLADEIEALVALGQLDRAAQLTSMLEQAAKRLHRGWALAQAERCRALLLAAHGDLAAASRAARAAVCRAERLELRLELARTLLVAGEIERRKKQKRSPHELLERAREIFEEVGAQLWAQRVQAELDRVIARRTGGDLTDSEKTMARLTASGLTNRQVAAQLFISPKTVEANLARVYRKLGIRSRAELGACLGSPR